MLQQTLMWTALPNGVVTGEDGAKKLRLSVFISPRLEATTGAAERTLAEFPDFLDWPAEMAAATFKVAFEGGPTVEATVLAPPATAGEPEPSMLWKAMFGSEPGTRVKSFQPPTLAARGIRSFPVRNVMAQISDVYTTVAAESPTKLPTLAGEKPDLPAVRLMLDDIALAPQERVTVARAMRARMAASPVRAVTSEPAPSMRTFSRKVAGTPARPALSAVAAAEGVFAMPGFSPMATSFAQVQEFYQPLTEVVKVGDRFEAVRLAMVEPKPDFHEVLGALGHYPEILRRLRLVLDLEVDYTNAMNSATTVRVIPTWDPALPTAGVTPRTRCQVTATKFVARPNTEASDYTDGMLELDDDGRFEVGQLDVDGAALQMSELARKLKLPTMMMMAPQGAAGAATPAQQPPDEPADEGLPALRSAGLWVARVERAAQMGENVFKPLADRTAALTAIKARHFAAAAGGAKPPLLAEVRPAEDATLLLSSDDLIRGVRIDVWDSGAEAWHSLCKRDGTYHFSNAALGVNETLNLSDEGWTTSALTQSPDGSEADVRLHQIMFRWQGWSLCASRPGEPVPEEGVPTEATEKYGLDVDFRATPGTLPRLRFGRAYRLRARSVDLAGNSVSLEEAGDDFATEPILYQRHEPLAAPVVVPRKEVATSSPGEFVDRPVLRSLNDAPVKDQVATADVAERHICPPRTSQLMAELHSMFDGPDAMKGDATTYQMILDRDKPLAAFYDVNRLILPYLPDPLAYAALVRITWNPRGEARTQALQVPFGEDWPKLLPFRVLVSEDRETNDAAFEANIRLLRIPARKADVVEVELSCVLKPDASRHMAVWNWTTQHVARTEISRLKPSAAEALVWQRDLADPKALKRWADKVSLAPERVVQLEKLGASLETGECWLLTPSRKMTIIHAVQQPLGVPKLMDFVAGKNIGDTFALLTGWSYVVGRSAAKVDLVAAWKDQLDDVREEGPREVDGSGHVVELPVGEADKAINLGTPMLYELLVPFALEGAAGAGAGAATGQSGGQQVMTVRHAIAPEGPPTLSAASATTATFGAARLDSGKARRLDASRARAGGAATVVGGRDPGTVRPATPGVVGLKPDGIGELPEVPRRHEFGDTKYRHVTYELISTTRHREYLPFSQADVDEGRAVITRTSEPLPVDVLSSARPAAPKLLYVVPIFGWDKQSDEKGVASTRKGGGLRIYMERPWFSSGAGELLGVVLQQAPGGVGGMLGAVVTSANDSLKPYVTRMGQDPLWATERTELAPKANQFLRSSATESGLRLEELGENSGVRVTAVGYPVAYDADRRLWYADIQIDTDDAYFPFVRLALARFQPKSVRTDKADVKLSRVVLADFAQLAPERSAGVAFDFGDKRKVNVTVTGPAPVRGPHGKVRPNQVEVTVEQRIPNIAGEMGWVPASAEVTNLPASRLREHASSWAGTVALPKDRGSAPMRLVIREYEVYPADAGPPAATMMMVAQPAARRIVYADAIEI